ITVLFFLPPAISIAHAGLAQIFFCLTITMALVTSRGWKSNAAPVDDALLRRAAAVTTALVYVQILLGATMRHNDAGLAIPDFPLAIGHLVPPAWNAKVAIHFAHRLGAPLVLSLRSFRAGFERAAVAVTRPAPSLGRHELQGARS